MKIFLTLTLTLLSMIILFGASVEKEPVDTLSSVISNKHITIYTFEIKRDSISQKADADIINNDEISNINSSYLNFRSLEKGRRILEKKYNLYT